MPTLGSDDRKLNYDGAIANYQEALHVEQNDDGCFEELSQALAEAQRSLGWALSNRGRSGRRLAGLKGRTDWTRTYPRILRATITSRWLWPLMVNPKKLRNILRWQNRRS